MNLKITLITGSHLSSNPRLVKEAKALLDAGYELHILCAQYLNELSEFDESIFVELNEASIHIINYQNSSAKGWFLRLRSALRLRLAKFNFFKSLHLLSWINLSRMLPEMKSALKHIQADIYIAHTLAALPAAAWASSFHNSKYAFDAEDFHSGETNDSLQKQLIISLENEFLESCTYLSTASPLSSELYKLRYPGLRIITLNNVFPFYNLPNVKAPLVRPIKLVWFSQTIGLNRGIQEFFSLLSNLPIGSFEVHLRGSHTADIRTELLASINEKWHSSIFFYQQCDSKYLDNWLGTFDIGLALESNTTLNRDICITNKIFQYITGGLAVVATDTAGQKWVFQEAPNIGFMIDQDKTELASDALKYWSENPEQLELAKQNSLVAAKTIFNWDLEKNKFLNQISLISKKN